MNSETHKASDHPDIVKYIVAERTGMQQVLYRRNVIGYIIEGKKVFHDGDRSLAADKGDLFYLNNGTHYIEDIPGKGKNSEQILFYFNPECLARTLNRLNTVFNVDVRSSHHCPQCTQDPFATYKGWDNIENFFLSVDVYAKDEAFCEQGSMQNLKFAELVSLIIMNNDCCIKKRIMDSIDPGRSAFEQAIYDNIRDNLTLKELSTRCNKSPAVFTRDFKLYFNDPPHRWFTRQRMMRARMMLISSNKAVGDIGLECGFPNASHFIKQFRKAYGTTPAQYRQGHSGNSPRPEDDSGSVRFPGSGKEMVNHRMPDY